MADEQRIQAYIQVVQELLSCPNGEELNVLQQHSDLVDAGLVHVIEAVVEQFRQRELIREADWLENMAAQLAPVLRMAEAPPDSDAINEQQVQAYIQLVQELLSCPNGEEPEVLQRHQDLVDARLVEVMGQVAAILRQQGQENNANWLENMTAQLAQDLEVAGRTSNATSGDLQTISQELVQITDQRDMARKVALCQQALELVPRENNKQLWAFQVLLGSSLQQNPLGDLGQNLEDAISAYEQALELITYDVMPIEWAETINGLANTYSKRLWGNPAQNIENAIAYYKQALQVRTHEVMPVEWAESINNLAVAYANRILGDRAENIENAIAYYKQALQVRTVEDMPIEWAQSMMNLASAYLFRIHGDRSRNIEDAITSCEQSLQVVTCKDMPIDWALSMMNLATAYVRRIRGDRAQNIEDAIAAYEQALQVITRETMPIEWTKLLVNLSSAYLGRTQGDRARNIEDAISACEQALQVRTYENMPVEWAEVMHNLSLAYSARIHGDLAQNGEKAIVMCQQALQVRTREDMPIEWAQSMMNLAKAYLISIRGDYAQKFEDAISACEQALQVITRETMPVEWAEAMNSLAYAYHCRIRGDLTQNVEQAIAMCQQVLQVRTYKDMPTEWAISMMNLAEAYSKSIQGDRAQKLENSIAAYEQALQVITRETMPVEWAEAMRSLAYAYRYRIRGDRTLNLEDAVSVCEQALQVSTRETIPVQWASTMRTLANTYMSRIAGTREENIEKAIRAYKQALEVMTAESMPIEWARVMSDLAGAYSSRIRGSRDQNIENAISACEQALQVITRETMPVEWAEAMTTLADAYYKRIYGDRAQNIEQAISIFEQVLEVYTCSSFPDAWAVVYHNLALAYCKRIEGDHTENTEKAIKIFECVLEVQKLEANPRSYRITAHNLADLYAKHNYWFKAQEQYKNAIAATEVLCQASLFKRNQESELSEIADLYRSATYVYAKVGDLPSAIATIEQGRARSLSETLQRDQSNLEAVRHINPELVNRYQTAANTLRQLESTERQARLDGNYHYGSKDFRSQIFQARQALQSCLIEIRQIPGYETFLLPPTFEDIAVTLLPNHPIIYLLHNNVHDSNRGLALILLRSSAPNHGEEERTFWLPASSLKRLEEVDKTTDFINVNQEAIHIIPIWLDALTSTEITLITANQDNTGWFDVYYDYILKKVNRTTWQTTIDSISQYLWETVMAPIVNRLTQAKVVTATLIPTGVFGFLPLHATWVSDLTCPTGRRYACDTIQFTYAPNALALNFARTVAARTLPKKLLAINEPQPVTASPLPNSSAETAKAISTFSATGNWKRLQHEAATRAAVLEALPHYSVAHFACHGSNSFGDPLDSGLLMANNENITLRDLLDLKLQGLHLTILSACETGIPSPKLADEVISLPTGLLHAGAAGVISSLWSVDDRSTMLLLSKFYELWRTENQEPSEALRQAQIWLRDSTEAEIAPLLGKRARNPTNRPFFHPYYWAAFSYTGV